MFGYRLEELLDRPIELLVPERFRADHVAKRDGYFAAPRVRPMGRGLDLFGLRKDGHEVPVEISLSPLEANGRTFVVSTIRDISERKRADVQLRNMEKRYRTLVEGIPAVTFMASLGEGANERELYVSPQVEELLGFTQKEWLENPILWFTQLHPDDRNRWHEEFARTCSTGERFRSVYRFIARDDRVVWVHGEVQVVKDDDGRPLFLQGVAFDITGIKQAEEDLRALNQTLEQRVAERTQALEARTHELERSNKELEEFAGVAAHDLKAPLSTMNSHMPRLAAAFRVVADGLGELEPSMSREVQKMVLAGQDGRLHAEVNDSLQRSLKAAKRMQTLIDDLLDYAKVKTEGKELTPTSCAEAVAMAVASLEARIEDCAAEVTYDDRLPTVMADRSQLVQLLENLIGNALKYRGDEPPRIRVSAARQESDWAISIQDNGIGIDPNPKHDFLAKIFKLGVESRLHGRDKYPGSGIGLSTCKKIVERHGGRIWAESAGLNLGTTITFTMPAG